MERSKKTSFDFYMLPLVLAVAVVPLLTMMTSYSSGIGKYTWASGGSFVDFFLGFKRGALILLGAVIIILFCASLHYFICISCFDFAGSILGCYRNIGIACG